MSIEISNSTVELWIKEGIKNAIQSMLRDSYGTGANLKKAMDKAIADSEAQITAALKIAISQACVSPDFLKGVEKDIAAALASKYRGAFDGVITAAAKQAARDEIVTRRVAEMTKQAAGVTS